MRANRRRLVTAVLTVVIVIAVIAAGAVLIRPAGKADTDSADGGDISITLTISCEEVLEEKSFGKLPPQLKKDGALPKDGLFADHEKLTLDKEEDLLTALEGYCGENGIALEVIPGAETMVMTDYVYGIGGLHEGDCTKSSGWIYYADGIEPAVGMREFRPDDGSDIRIEFIVY